MEKGQHRTGLVSVSFRAHAPCEILRTMQAAGLCYIEWGSDVHAPCHDVQHLDELAALQREFGISCCSYGTYFRLGQTPICELESYILAAKRLGTDVLRVWCGTKSGTDMSEDEILSLFVDCRMATALAQQHDVTICTECHMGTFTEHPEHALRLMKEINSPHFRTYWQPFQWRSAEQNLSYLQAILPYVLHLHVFQWKQNDRFSLADGTAEWQAYLSLLDTSHTLLLEFMPDNRIESLAAEADALRTIARRIS